MNENIKLLIEKVSKDEAVLAKLKELRDPDAAYALVSGIQGGFTKEEFMDAMQKIAAAGEGELSDEEVSAAAGGSTSDFVSWAKKKSEEFALSSAVTTI